MKGRSIATLTLPLMLTVSLLSTLQAGEADVQGVEAERAADGSYRFLVTVRHADTGWDHYADNWEILDSRGQVLATRTLHHPHVNEQPFTRALSGVRLPPGTDAVRVRARDSVHGYGGRSIRVKLPQP